MSRKPWVIVITRGRCAHVPNCRGQRVTFDLYRYVRRAGRLESDHGSAAIAPYPALHRDRGMARRIPHYCDRGSIHAAFARVGLCECRLHRCLSLEHPHCSPPPACRPRVSECMRRSDGGSFLQWLRGTAAGSARRAARTYYQFSARLCFDRSAVAGADCGSRLAVVPAGCTAPGAAVLWLPATHVRCRAAFD